MQGEAPLGSDVQPQAPNILRSSYGATIWVTRSDRPVLRLATAGLRVRSPDQAKSGFIVRLKGSAEVDVGGSMHCR